MTAAEKILRTGFVHTSCPSRIILGIALAGTGSGPGIGRAAVTSPCGFGSHGPEGVRQAGILWIRRKRLIAQEADHPRVIVHGKNMERGA
jgi:hypothetical protein